MLLWYILITKRPMGSIYFANFVGILFLKRSCNLRTCLWEFPYMQFLVDVLDKAIQDNKKLSIVSWKGFKRKPFQLKKSAFKIFVLKFVKMQFLPKNKMKNWLLDWRFDSSSIQNSCKNHFWQKRVQFSRGTYIRFFSVLIPHFEGWPHILAVF